MLSTGAVRVSMCVVQFAVLEQSCKNRQRVTRMVAESLCCYLAGRLRIRLRASRDSPTRMIHVVFSGCNLNLNLPVFQECGG